MDQAPRVSASGAARDAACPSSVARSLELYRFEQDHGLTGGENAPEAFRGTAIHAVCAEIPFVAPDLGFGESFNVFDRALMVMETHKARATAAGKKYPLRPGYESWLCGTFVAKRDAFINTIINALPLGRECCERISIELDERRLYYPFTGDGRALGLEDAWPAVGTDPLKEFSGLPDCRVIVEGGGVVLAGVLDYKSGQAEYDPADNRQLESLLGLSAIDYYREPQTDSEGKPVGGMKCRYPDRGFVAIACESESNDPLRMVTYEAADVKRVADEVRHNPGPSIALAVRYRDEGLADPSPLLAAELDNAATFGSHCVRCKGGPCCGRLKLVAGVTDYALNHRYDHLLTEPIRNPDDTVNIETLSKTLHLSTALEKLTAPFLALTDRCAELARELNAKGETVPDVVFSPGGNQTKLNENLGGLREIHEVCMTLGAPADFDAFVSAVMEQQDIKMPATALRAYLGKLLSAKLGRDVYGSDILKELDTALGARSPIVNVQKAAKINLHGDLLDVVSETAAHHEERVKQIEQLRAQKEAELKAKAAPAPAPASVAAPITAPAVPLTTPPVAVAAPKPKRPRRAKVTAPAPAPAEVAVEVAAIPEDTTLLSPAPRIGGLFA